MKVPYSASELADIARTGTGQDVVDAIEAMTSQHGAGITALMMHSAGAALVADRFFAVADWERPGCAMHWSPAVRTDSPDTLEGA